MVRIRRSPELAAADLQRRMENVMQQMLRDLHPTAGMRAWVPRADVYEAPDRILITLELPGVAREEIDVVVEGPCLRISGTRPEPDDPDLRCWLQMEIAHGPFERVITLPIEPDPDRITAAYRDGFLVIDIPRTAGRTVPVEGD